MPARLFPGATRLFSIGREFLQPKLLGKQDRHDKGHGIAAFERREVVYSMIVQHPIFNLQLWCLAEMFDIVCDDNCVPTQNMPGNHCIVQPNG